MPTGVSRINIDHPVPSPSIVSSAAASTSTAALTTTLRKQNVASKRGVALVPGVAGVNELGQIADGASGAVAFLAVAAGAAGVSFAASAALEKRVEEAIAKAESYGIDLTDLYYDFDVPGDQYPFGDGEEWMPKSWKPPKTGDSKYLPTKMLGQIQIRTNQYEAIQVCNEKGIDIADLCVPFEDYEGEFDTNAKRLNEMRKRIEAAK